jgi:hypothetical protein
MEEDETIVTYFLRVDEVVNTIRGFREIDDESFIVDKILGTLPMIFDTQVSTLEERKDLDKITMDEMHGILISYEMRIEIDWSSNKEGSFKASNGTKMDKHTSKTISSEKPYEEEANFMKKLTRGSDKHKAKIPFKILNCGKIGHFT